MNIKIGDRVFINPHGEGSVHHGIVTKITDVAVEADEWVSWDGKNRVAGTVGMPRTAVIAVLPPR